jgi:hypothetical protein
MAALNAGMLYGERGGDQRGGGGNGMGREMGGGVRGGNGGQGGRGGMSQQQQQQQLGQQDLLAMYFSSSRQPSRIAARTQS